jgi:hypothetical protein
MAVDMLLSVTHKRDFHDDWLNSVYQAVSEEDYYDASILTGIMQQFKP